MVAEVEAFFLKPVGRDFYFATGIEGVEDAPVFSQRGVDFAHLSVGLAVSPVVVRAPALVGAEALVGAALNRRAALKAGPCIHKVKVQGARGTAGLRA